MRWFKYIFIGVLILGAGIGAGVFAAQHYVHTRSIVQEQKDRIQAEKDAQLKAKEEKAAAAKEKERKKQEALDRRLGRAEEPDQEIRGLTADMHVIKDLDGTVYYRYEDPREEGIFIQPYLVTEGERTTLHVILRHRGHSPQGFAGIELWPDEETVYYILAQGQVVTDSANGGVMEWCDQVADANTRKALRHIGRVRGGKISMANRPQGSNDDRMLSATETQRISNIMELYDILRKKNAKKS